MKPVATLCARHRHATKPGPEGHRHPTANLYLNRLVMCNLGEAGGEACYRFSRRRMARQSRTWLSNSMKRPGSACQTVHRRTSPHGWVLRTWAFGSLRHRTAEKFEGEEQTCNHNWSRVGGGMQPLEFGSRKCRRCCWKVLICTST